MSFSDAFDMLFSLNHDMEKILSTSLPSRTIADSKSLFDIFTKAIWTTKKRLVNDIQTVKDALKSFEITNVVLVGSDWNIADALMKDKSNSIVINSLRNERPELPIN